MPMKKAVMRKSKHEKQQLDAQYEPTPAERAVMDSFRSLSQQKPPAPVLMVKDGDGKIRVNPDHPDNTIGTILLMNALATTDVSFFHGLVNQITNAAAQGGKVDESALNFMLSVIKGVRPEDQIETMLAAQMAAVHMATMTFARRLANVENIPQQDSAERALNKLARTFAMQIEALKRYRTGGEQRVVVQHVHVADGGQAAVVGSVSQRKGGGDGEKT